jgi:hypothetical protein
MPREYSKDGDVGFIGLNSRDNPRTLEQQYLSKSQNMRLNRGVATCRKGLKRLTPAGLVGVSLRFATTFRNSSGQDLIVFITEDSLFTYNASTGTISAPVHFPGTEVIETTDEVDAFQALGSLYILRGYAKRPLFWDGGVSITTLPNAPTDEFPNSVKGIYNANRAIVQLSSDEIGVSDYLDLTKFALLDVFKINDGSNDEIVAIAPWVLNELVVFMRNRMYYASVGAGSATAGDAVIPEDSYVKVLATDIGCNARRTIAQAAGGMMFLSDFGIYFMQPSNATTPEGMRAGVLGQPISAPIDDEMLTINQNAVAGACGIYYDNRYYLAVPTGDSEINNKVFVYNFVNKAWESIDTFQTGMDVSFMVTALYNNKRRLFFIDKEQGIFLAEENENGDEYDNTTSAWVLPHPLPWEFDAFSFRKTPVDSQITTRAYNFQLAEDKRFSSVEIDISSTNGDQLDIYALASNPDSTTLLENYGALSTGTSTRDLPVRKICSACSINVQGKNGRPTIRGVFVNATPIGNNIQSSDS